MFFFLFFAAFFGSEMVELYFRSDKGVGVSWENPQQFPIPQPRAAVSLCALGKGIAGLRELLGFSQDSLSD